MNRQLLEALVNTSGLKTIRVRPSDTNVLVPGTHAGMMHKAEVHQTMEDSWGNPKFDRDRRIMRTSRQTNARFKRGQRLAKFRRGIATEAAVSNKPMNPLERFAASRNIKLTKKVKPFTPDKEVWHAKTKKWLDHKDPALHESGVNWVKPKWAEESAEWVPLSRNLTGGKSPKKFHSNKGDYREQMTGGDSALFNDSFRNTHKLTDTSLWPKSRRDKVESVFPELNKKDIKVSDVHRMRGDRNTKRLERGLRDGDTIPAPGLKTFKYWDEHGFPKRRDQLIGGNHRWAMAKALGIQSPKVLKLSQVIPGNLCEAAAVVDKLLMESFETIAADEIIRPKFAPPMWLDDVVMAGRRAYRKLSGNQQDNKQDKPRKMRMPKDNYYSSNQ